MKNIKNMLAIIFSMFVACALIVTGCKMNSSDDDNNNSSDSTAGTITLSDGTTSKTYTSLADAWAAIGDSGDYTITLGTGTYTVEEGTELNYSGSANIKISGLGSATYGSDVIITGNPNNNTEKTRNVIYVSGSGTLTLEDLTVKNTYGDGLTGDYQAEAVATGGTGNLAAYNCSFLSHQDTLRTTAKAWFYKCYIEGDVDFLWMEVGGTVALYEECTLVAVDDRGSTSAYFTAPRANVTTKVGKGLVIYNSTLEVESGITSAYLGRNPWSGSTSYYNQVAVINSPMSEGSVNAAIWKSAANGTSDQSYVGFKTDSTYDASTSSYGAVIDDDLVTAEYCGRNNILNRVYNTATSEYQADSESDWDIDSVISTNKWTVTTDDSTSGDAATTVTYDFTSDGANGYTDATVSGFAIHSSGSAQGVAGSTITVPVTGKCVVYVKGFYAGYGTIQATDGSTTLGESVYDFNNNSTSTVAEKAYIDYDASMTSVVITATTTSYITEVIVEYDDSLSYTAVTGISVTPAKSDATVGVADLMTATVTPTSATNSDVVWSSGDTDIATVNAITGSVTPAAAGSVTITATARDGSGITGSTTLTVTAATWKQAEWYTTDSTLDAEGTESSVFSFGSSSYKSLGSTVSFSDIAGDSISTAYGLKLNSSGSLIVSTTTAGQMTIVLYTGTGADGGLSVTGTNSTTVVAGSTSTSGTLKTYTFYLDGADTYTISRGGTSENYPIVYAEVDRGATPDTSYSYTLTGGVGTPYTSDDTFLYVSANSDNNGHGLVMTQNNYFTAWSTSNAVITLVNCAYDNAQTLVITDSDGNTVIPTAISSTDYVTTLPSFDSSTGVITIPEGGSGSNKTDGATTVISLGNSAAGTYTFTYTTASKSNYLHGVVIGAASAE